MTQQMLANWLYTIIFCKTGLYIYKLLIFHTSMATYGILSKQAALAEDAYIIIWDTCLICNIGFFMDSFINSFIVSHYSLSECTIAVVYYAAVSDESPFTEKGFTLPTSYEGIVTTEVYVCSD